MNRTAHRNGPGPKASVLITIFEAWLLIADSLWQLCVRPLAQQAPSLRPADTKHILAEFVPGENNSGRMQNRSDLLALAGQLRCRQIIVRKVSSRTATRTRRQVRPGINADHWCSLSLLPWLIDDSSDPAGLRYVIESYPRPLYAPGAGPMWVLGMS